MKTIIVNLAAVLLTLNVGLSQSSNPDIRAIKIGNQIWMTENLNTDTFLNGDKIYLATTSEKWHEAGFSLLPAKIRDEFYNWYVLADSRGVCPIGWHVPKNNEWTELMNYLGKNPIRITEQMKSKTDWWESNWNGKNSSGFNAFPKGFFYDDGFIDRVGRSAIWWSLDDSLDYAKTIGIDVGWGWDTLHRNYYSKKMGLSIRCLKNDAAEETGLIEAKADYSNNDEHGIEFNEESYSRRPTPDEAGFIINQNPKTNQIQTERPLFSNRAEFDSNVFPEVQIGTQIWMSENLNLDTFRNGEKIQEARTAEEWKTAGDNGVPAWCYYNNDSVNGIKFGKLYNWYAVNDTRGLAPAGWHSPSDSEWNELQTFLGQGACQKMKSSCGWESYKLNIICLNCRPTIQEGLRKATCNICNDTRVSGKEVVSGNGNNSCGFNGLPGGSRLDFGGFFNVGRRGFWWCSNEISGHPIIAWGYDLGNFDKEPVREFNSKGSGYSVRCVKD